MEKRPKRVKLVFENMTDDHIGLFVTVFNQEIVEPSKMGVIVGYDEQTIHIRYGESKKVNKIPYSPQHIIIRLLQKGFNYFDDYEVKKLTKIKDPVKLDPVAEEKPVVATPKKTRKPRQKKATAVIQW